MRPAPSQVNNRVSPRTGRQLELALELVPLKVRRHGLRDAHSRPLVSMGRRADGLFGPSWRVPTAEAWADFPSGEYARTGNSFAAIVIDCDGRDAPERIALALMDGRVPQPNVMVTRPASGGTHATWYLAAPVHRGAQARQGPIRLLARIGEYLCAVLEGDPGFQGVLTHNPMNRPQGRDLATTWGRQAPYDLKGELLAFVPRGWRRPKQPATAYGRNCTLFDAMMKWAGSPANIGNAVLSVAIQSNREWFDHPLPDSEVAGIARSVERYREQWRRAGRFIDTSREAEIAALYAQGVPVPEIAERCGVARRTAYDVLARDLPLLASGNRQAPGGHAKAAAARNGIEERNAAIRCDVETGMSQRAVAARHGVSRRTVQDVLAAKPSGLVALLLARRREAAGRVDGVQCGEPYTGSARGRTLFDPVLPLPSQSDSEAE